MGWSPEQLAKKIGRTPGAVRYWIRSKWLRASRIGKGKRSTLEISDSAAQKVIQAFDGGNVLDAFRRIRRSK